MEIRARAVGDITGTLSRIELGSTHGFGGFLGSQRNGKGIVISGTKAIVTGAPYMHEFPPRSVPEQSLKEVLYGTAPW